MSRQDYDLEEEYNSKRNFSKTKEPKGKKAGKGKNDGKSKHAPIFVIQKHDASTEHYDIRLEIDGTLKSWACPKGPSTDPSVKRLCIPTEDHPMSYADFEGTIPKAEYGGGTVMIWDSGTYTNIKKNEAGVMPMGKCYKNGQIEVEFHGEKLDGGYAFVRAHMGGSDKTQWLLVKMDDGYADARRNPTSTENNSVVSGRTMNEIEQEEGDD